MRGKPRCTDRVSPARASPQFAHDRNAAQARRDRQVGRLALKLRSRVRRDAAKRRSEPAPAEAAAAGCSEGASPRTASRALGPARAPDYCPRDGDREAPRHAARMASALRRSSRVPKSAVDHVIGNAAASRQAGVRSFFMCGIAGWYRRGGKPVAEEAIVSQCDRLRQRGPDDAGYLTDGDFGFGMRRLSIIDVEGGHQPIFSPDGRYAIVFNGEIVNHPALRRELEGGYAFQTDHSDTETILAAYLRWGDDAWLRLEGMYAVAIWDKHAKTLTLARDPIGIKPLFFTEQNGGIAFASEITALARAAGPSLRPRRRRRRRLLLLRPHAAAAHDLQAGPAAGAGPCAARRRGRRAVDPPLLAGAPESRSGHFRSRLDRADPRGAAADGRSEHSWPTCRSARSCPAAWTPARSRRRWRAPRPSRSRCSRPASPARRATRPRPQRGSPDISDASMSSCRCSRRRRPTCFRRCRRASTSRRRPTARSRSGICRGPRPSM